jgi:aryl-alcohol dehydrogenase-like predicted oxidoreductase
MCARVAVDSYIGAQREKVAGERERRGGRSAPARHLTTPERIEGGAGVGVPTRVLGRTGTEVTTLGYGAMELRSDEHNDVRPIEPRHAEVILNTVLDAGITLIDTSIDYGLSEEYIGRFIAHRRDEYFLATKCGCLVPTPPPAPGQRVPHAFDRANLVAGIEQSLRRLRTEHIDLMQFHHNPSVEVLESEGALEVLEEFRTAGKIRFIGHSGNLPTLQDVLDLDVFDAFQIPYSGFDRDHEVIIGEAAERGAGTIIRSATARMGRALDAWEMIEHGPLAELRGGADPLEFMLRFVLSHPGVDTAIVGTINPQHLRENIAAASKGPLDPETYAEAKRRFPESAMPQRRDVPPPPVPALT